MRIIDYDVYDDEYDDEWCFTMEENDDDSQDVIYISGRSIGKFIRAEGINQEMLADVVWVEDVCFGSLTR